MEPFVIKEQLDRVELLHLNRWKERYPKLTAGFSSRNGGISEGVMSSLNCALHVGDNPQRVIENRRRISAELGFSFESWTCAEQVHGNDVMIVTTAERGKGNQSRTEAIQSKDALVTNEKDVLLTAFFADCVPLYFYDPIREVIGLAHAGWRGSVLNIAAATVEAMERTYGSQRDHIQAAIGPAIGACCYEVDETVISQVNDSRVIEAKENGKYMLDLKQLNRQFMIKAGIMPMNIEISELCTSCNTATFFSHRKEQGKTGRMMSWIALKMG